MQAEPMRDLIDSIIRFEPDAGIGGRKSTFGDWTTFRAAAAVYLKEYCQELPPGYVERDWYIRSCIGRCDPDLTTPHWELEYNPGPGRTPIFYVEFPI